MEKILTHVIVKERVETYKDFTINLLYYIYNYYIDKESLDDDNDIRNHFNWCYKCVCDNFKKEGILFDNNEELKEYFYTYYYTQFYKIKVDPIKDIGFKFYENFWNSIFNIEKYVNKDKVKLFIEIYLIFDKTFINVYEDTKIL